MATPVNLSISTRCSFGPVLITCTSGGVAFPLAGYSAFAEVRHLAKQRGDLKSYGDTVILDLAPVIAADDADGLIIIPEIDYTITADLCPAVAEWDIILQDPTGKRLTPIIAGRVTISDTVTQPAITAP